MLFRHGCFYLGEHLHFDVTPPTDLKVYVPIALHGTDPVCGFEGLFGMVPVNHVGFIRDKKAEASEGAAGAPENEDTGSCRGRH